MKKIAAGVYVNDRQELEFDIPEILRAMGLPDTEANRDSATRAAIAASQQVFPSVKNLTVLRSHPQQAEMPNWYVPPLGTPLYWRNEQSGVLPRAMEAYMVWSIGNGPSLTEAQRLTVLAYLRYAINAPCWRGDAVPPLRELAAQMQTCEQISDFLWAAMDAGIDLL